MSEKDLAQFIAEQKIPKDGSQLTFNLQPVDKSDATSDQNASVTGEMKLGKTMSVQVDEQANLRAPSKSDIMAKGRRKSHYVGKTVESQKMEQTTNKSLVESGQNVEVQG